MLKKLALISAVSAFAMGTALAQSPNMDSKSGTPSAQDSSKSTTPSAQDSSKSMTPSAQDSTKSTSPSAGKAEFVAAQKPDQMIASKFKGTDVVGDDNQKVGDVSDILFAKDGSKIDAYVISVGGFLGIGSKDVALPPTAFQMVPGDSGSATGSSPKLKISMNKDQLKQAPNFEPYKQPSTTGTGGSTSSGGSTSPGGMKR